MSDQIPKQPWEQKLREAAGHVEDDLRRVITYINDEVVPDVRRNGSVALKTAATELHKLADRMDRTTDQTGGNPPPPITKP